MSNTGFSEFSTDLMGHLQKLVLGGREEKKEIYDF
jgi:hypothetical protein